MFAPAGQQSALDPDALRAYAERLRRGLDEWNDLGHGLVALLERVDSGDLVGDRRAKMDSLADRARNLAERLKDRAAAMEEAANRGGGLVPGIDLGDILREGTVDGASPIDAVVAAATAAVEADPTVSPEVLSDLVLANFVRPGPVVDVELDEIVGVVSAIVLAEQLKKAEPAELRQILATTPPDRLDAAIAQMSDSEVEAMVNKIEVPPFPFAGPPPGPRFPWDPPPPPPVSADEVYLYLGENLSLDTLRRIGTYTERINPEPTTVGAGYEAHPEWDLFEGADGLPVTSEFNQGALGDCYFIAAVIAVGEANPEALASMIEKNPNGTYTVTFADGVQQVVTPDIVMKDGKEVYAHSDQQTLFLPLIEKAYAQRRAAENPGESGYELIRNGGVVDDAVKILVGGEGSHTRREKHTAQSIQNQLNNDDLVFANTQDAANMPTDANGKPLLVPGHYYIITSVDTVNNQITLVNPHDADRAPVVMSMSDFESAVRAIGWNEAP